MLNSNENGTPRNTEIVCLLDYDRIAVPLPDYDEVQKRLPALRDTQSKGTDGLPVDLFKYGGKELY